MEAIIIAVIGVVGTLGSAWLSLKAKQAAEKVDRKTETNHGKEPWEYLEMVQDVKDGLIDVRADVLGMRENLHRTARTQEDLHVAFIEHTAQNAENLDYLIRLIEERKTSGR